MRYNKIFTVFIIVTLIGLISYGFYNVESKSNRLAKVNKNDDNAYIAVNECFMWIGNNGMGSHNPISDDSGFYWPGGENATIPAIFADGLIWGAKVGREIRVNGATYRYGLQAGKILDNGEPDSPENSRYRIYKIRKGWESLPDGEQKSDFETDYNEWPVEDGAPWVDLDGDGVFTRGVDEPHFVGDEVLWCVSNDMDPSRSTFTYGTLPMGLEQHTLVFAFQRTGDLGDMVFKKYTIINKGSTTLREMYLSYWSDTDMGNAGDDYTGCDTLLSLGYTWNGDNDDEDFYGPNPPSVGYDFFQGPIIPYDASNPQIQRFNLPDSAKFGGRWIQGMTNLPMTGFTFYENVTGTIYEDPELGTANGSIQFYNYMTGKLWNGDPFVDPNTQLEVDIILAGDPVAGTGWYEGEGWPGGPTPNDRRHVMNSGPFTMAPGDTQEVVVGILIGRGTDNINSITELKRKDEVAQIAYNLDFNLTPSPQAPEVSIFEDNQAITLYWNDNAESYSEVDKLIEGQGFEDETYDFEGYRVWQFSDEIGSNKTLIASFDILNEVTQLTQNLVFGGVVVEDVVQALDNAGLSREITITLDELSGVPLVNNNPYYFAVTAYGYSPSSDPRYLENPPRIMEVFPGSGATSIDTKGLGAQDLVPAIPLIPSSTEVNFKIVDPTALTGETYQVTFDIDEDDQKSYSLKNISTDVMLLENRTDIIFEDLDELNEPYLANTGDKFVIDGFTLNIRDVGAETIANAGSKYAVVDVIEVKGPNGVVLEEPVSVDNQENSTKQWSVFAQGLNNRYNWQASRTREGLGYDFYEIRFTSTGSDFFASGYNVGTLNSIPTKDDAKGEGKVPFEVWNIGQTIDDESDDIRMMVKVLDKNITFPEFAINDNKWSQLSSGNWEEIYAYEDSTMDADNLPDQSGRQDYTDHKFGAFVFSGSQPQEGTVIRIVPAIPIAAESVFEVTMPTPDLDNKELAKDQISKVGVFPNPYFGTHALEVNKYDRYMRFINLPKKSTVRIFSLAGSYITKLEKDDNSDFVDWDIRNKDGLPVASGMYIAYVEMPGVGTKILKLAVILEAQYIDRI